MMVEPTESESLEELDRFCDAMIIIHKEILEIERGDMDPQNNLLKNAPHTIEALTANEWPHPYSGRSRLPGAVDAEHKFWPSVGRIDNPYGDRNFVCTCELPA